MLPSSSWIHPAPPGTSSNGAHKLLDPPVPLGNPAQGCLRGPLGTSSQTPETPPVLKWTPSHDPPSSQWLPMDAPSATGDLFPCLFEPTDLPSATEDPIPSPPQAYGSSHHHRGLHPVPHPSCCVPSTPLVIPSQAHGFPQCHWGARPKPTDTHQCSWDPYPSSPNPVDALLHQERPQYKGLTPGPPSPGFVNGDHAP